MANQPTPQISSISDIMEIKVVPTELAGIFSISDEKAMDISITNPPDDADDITVQFTCADAWGNPVGLRTGIIALNRTEGFSTRMVLPSDPGYYLLSYGIQSGADSTLSGTGYISFAVIPDVKINAKDESSPFGVNTHFNQGWDPIIGEIVSKVGIAWIRDGEASLDDRAYPVAKANHLCYLPCFTWYQTPLAENKKADGTWDFNDIAEKHQQYAKKYGEYVDYYDLTNEPHGPWSAALGGSWNGGEWLNIFVEYGRTVTNAIKTGDPGAKVLWEDIDQLLWYRHFLALGAADVIDVISPHPYSLHRSIPLPEQQMTLNQIADFREFIQLHGLSWSLWAGEVGFSSFKLTERTPTPFYTPNTDLQQAQMLTRIMVMFLSHGCDKVFWYDFMNDGQDADNPEHNFGLVRHDHSPKPAVVAYANLINRLRDCKWLGSYAIGGAGNACAYMSKASKPTVIAWKQNGASTEILLVPSDVESVTITDIFGSAKELKVANHQIALELSESPIYVDGLLVDDVIPFITGR
ncbi:MAG: hypothetical protein ACYC0V_02995 [Armatimonadota bacterium]